MKITELMAKQRQMLSFEVFPPKNGTLKENVSQAALEVAKLHPDFISVTYGAGGSTDQYTVWLAKEMQRLGVDVLAHLTCVSMTKDRMDQQIVEMEHAEIENVMALRGDLPQTGEVASDYPHASDLIHELKKHHFCIGAACYPEIHPESNNQKEDIRYLKMKQDAGCDFFTTQMFFDNHLLFNFLYKIREAGITIPVIPGIMPITSKKQISQVMKLSNSSLPQRFKTLVDRYGDSENAMCQAGIAYATEQIIDLYANGIQVVHVYTMNKPAVAAQIKNNLSEIVGLPL
ncbi:MAG: methylenetetrahydrofolate reductase [Clostridia bacterium]|nr:methylenetetrahydrofolate reductase [Clostridia bacterium]